MSLRNLIFLIVMGVFITGCATAVNEETRAADNQRIAARALEIGTTLCQNKDSFSGWKKVKLDDYFDFRTYKGGYWDKYKGRVGGGYGEVGFPHAQYYIDPQEGGLIFPLKQGCIIRVDNVEPMSFGKVLKKQATLFGFDTSKDFIVLVPCYVGKYKGRQYCENSTFFEIRGVNTTKPNSLRAIAFKGGPLDKSIELRFGY